MNTDKQTGNPQVLSVWAGQIAQAYRTRSVCLFIIAGNVHDLFPVTKEDGQTEWVALEQYLFRVMLAKRQIRLSYDVGNGISFFDQASSTQFARLLGAEAKMGVAASKPEVGLAAIEQVLTLCARVPEAPKHAGVILRYAETIVPHGDALMQSAVERAGYVRLLDWSRNPEYLQQDFSTFLLTEMKASVHNNLLDSQYTVVVDVPYPDRPLRQRYIQQMFADHPELDQRVRVLDNPKDYRAETAQYLGEICAGLTLTNIRTLLGIALYAGETLDTDKIKQFKKRVIEASLPGLIEYVEPKHGLDAVVGQDAAAKRLREDARLLAQGKARVAPSGYLIMGPMGTGKTWLATCYAGEVGIPCVRLLNFRSKWVGETEANLEKILRVLLAIGPVCVQIDEADTSVGSRESGGDSGVDQRVFGKLASVMGDSANRGRIVWMLMTNRPWNLPVDLKRPGRCEVHIPLFHPSDPETVQKLFTGMCAKLGIKADLAGGFPPAPEGMLFTGATVESLANEAQRLAELEGGGALTRKHLEAALAEYIPPSYADEIRMQELGAILECTHQSFLPEGAKAIDHAAAILELGQLRARLGV